MYWLVTSFPKNPWSYCWKPWTTIKFKLAENEVNWIMLRNIMNWLILWVRPNWFSNHWFNNIILIARPEDLMFYPVWALYISIDEYFLFWINHQSSTSLVLVVVVILQLMWASNESECQDKQSVKNLDLIKVSISLVTFKIFHNLNILFHVSYNIAIETKLLQFI